MNQPLSKPKRVAAVDVLRAITMTLMLFVNDFAGIPDIPYWLHHAKMTEDMMGFSDVVFPAFFFCMGMSVVLAIDARYSKGDSVPFPPCLRGCSEPCPVENLRPSLLHPGLGCCASL